MKTIEISDSAYQSLTAVHGDVAAFLEQLAAEAREVAAVQEGIDDYKAGRFRPIEEFGEEHRERYGIELPNT
jgi:predicted transcriptional regulator